MHRIVFFSLIYKLVILINNVNNDITYYVDSIKLELACWLNFGGYNFNKIDFEF